MVPGITGEEIEQNRSRRSLHSDLICCSLWQYRAEDEEDESDKKKGKKKKKKVVEIVYDEDLDKAIAKKKHKRGDEGWEED